MKVVLTTRRDVAGHARTRLRALIFCLALFWALYTLVVFTLAASRLQSPNPDNAIQHYFSELLPGAPEPACVRIDHRDQHYGTEYTCHLDSIPFCKTGHVGIVGGRIAHTYLNQCSYAAGWFLLSLDVPCTRGVVRDGYYYETGIGADDLLLFGNDCKRAPVAFGTALWLLVKPEGRLWCPDGFLCDKNGNYPDY